MKENRKRFVSEKRKYIRYGFGIGLMALLWLCSPLQGNAADKEKTFDEVRESYEEEVDAYIRQQMENYDFSEIERGLQELFPESAVETGKVMDLIWQGKLLKAVKMMGAGMKDTMLGDMTGMKRLFISILVIGIVSALFAEFADIFSGGHVAQVGFYFLYLLLMAILTKAFVSVAEFAVTAMESTVLFVKLFIPTWFLVVGTSFGGATAVFYYEVMLLVAYLVESFLLQGILPFIYSYVILALLNGIWAEERLSLLLDFLKKGILFAQKISMGAILGLSLVQSVIVPVLDGLKLSVIRKAVSALPGVGGATQGVAELVLGSAVLIKNSMGVFLMLVLLFSCFLPIGKLLLVGSFMKLGGALSGIISDKRISGCADRVGEGCFLLLRCLFTSLALFIIVIGIVAYSIR